jgi:oxygen-independent coproporphyrinogen-3 oxidase
VRRGDAARRAAFVSALGEEARRWGARGFAAGLAFDTIYLGGGTPSTLPVDGLGWLLAELRSRLPLAADARVTLEANPEDVDARSVAAWRAVGVHTLSLGVQSFADDSLRFLGRRHDGNAARAAVEVALGAGFPVVSVDLIYGLPGQSASAWSADLAAAAALAPQHLSCYQLTVHEGTAFGTRRRRGTLRELPDATQAERFRATHEELAARGFTAYEISNFARRAEHRSRHNRKYWRHVPYLGLGPSAHSFDGASRWWNERRLGAWESALAEGRLPVSGSEAIGPRERALEHLLLGLRSSDGVDLARLSALGLDVATHPLLPRLLDEGLLRRDGERLLASLAGWCVADGLAAALAATPAAGIAAGARLPGPLSSAAPTPLLPGASQ